MHFILPTENNPYLLHRSILPKTESGISEHIQG